MKLKKMSESLALTPGKKVAISDLDPTSTLSFDKKESDKVLKENRKQLKRLQLLLYAEHKHSLLIILQGMDTSGKDGTISHVMEGLNPQSCRVASFKTPTPEELDHDFLWRIHKVTPAKSEITLFNRSYYEDVLIVRVHNLVPEEVWSKRFSVINDFEKLLTENGSTILKFFLNISKDEQKKRLQERLSDPQKNWKMNLNDLKERQYWQQYMTAYEDVINRCGTDHAPWYVIPSDKKWFRNLAISEIIRETLENLNMKLPKPVFDPKSIVFE